MDMDVAVARIICAHSLSGFCQNVGGHFGCKVGRGKPASGDLCVASNDQLMLSGNLATARAVIAFLQAALEDKLEG